MRTNISTLEAQPLLKGMDPQHLQLLAQDCVPAEFRAGELIFKEGGVANRFYLIVDGNVQLESSVMETDSVPIQIIGPGDLLGCSWLFPSGAWQFDARAITQVRALCFYGTHLRELCETNTGLGYELMKRVSGIIILRLQAVRRKLVERAQSHTHV
jgi:CRP/FNR family cyclic AMP-dependent transcriptional regulator